MFGAGIITPGSFSAPTLLLGMGDKGGACPVSEGVAPRPAGGPYVLGTPAHCRPQAWECRIGLGGTAHVLTSVPAGKVTTQSWGRLGAGCPHCGRGAPTSCFLPNTQACPAKLCLPAWESRCGGKADGPLVTEASDTGGPYPLQPSSCPLAVDVTTPLPRPGQGASSPKAPQSFFWDCFFL